MAKRARDEYTMLAGASTGHDPTDSSMASLQLALSARDLKRVKVAASINEDSPTSFNIGRSVPAPKMITGSVKNKEGLRTILDPHKANLHLLTLPAEILNKILEFVLISKASEVNVYSRISPLRKKALRRPDWKVDYRAVLQVCRALRVAGAKMYYQSNIIAFEDTQVALMYFRAAKEIGGGGARKMSINYWSVESGCELMEELMEGENEKARDEEEVGATRKPTKSLSKVDTIYYGEAIHTWYEFLVTVKACMKQLGNTEASLNEVLGKLLSNRCSECEKPNAEDETRAEQAGVDNASREENSRDDNDDAANDDQSDDDSLSDDEDSENESSDSADRDANEITTDEQSGELRGKVKLEAIQDYWGRCTCSSGLSHRTRSSDWVKRYLEYDSDRDE
ncbi:Hypothetical protein D9617_24g017240 [Elsinoe fawcettii]|nr:Hypothetical protein D9617_24g017240 [Elsinoe fawcettii]